MKKKTLLSAAALQTLLTPTAEGEVLAPEATVATPEPVVPAAVPEVVVDTQAIEALQTQFDAFKLEAEAASTLLQEKLAAAEATNLIVKAGASDLKDIVVSQVARMRLGLKIAAVDMTNWTPEAVVQEFHATSESFMKALPVGSVIPKEDPKAVDKVIATSIDQSAFKSLGF